MLTKLPTKMVLRTEGRRIVIYADPRKARRFIAGAVLTDADGAIEDFTLKVWAIGDSKKIGVVTAEYEP